MAQQPFININFPFSDDPDGKFLEMTTDTKRAIKSDLMHLLLTTKGERLYMPDFGTNLRQYIFDQNDGPTSESIITEINSAIAKFLPNLTITQLTTVPSEDTIHGLVVKIDYVVTIGALKSNDTVSLTF